MICKPAIVICAYNRPDSLSRLLRTISLSHYDSNDIDLIFSIDYSGDDSVLNLSEDFYWNFGSKRIITHSKHLGLKQHILFCGDLVETYGSIILLEDDLVVSPHFYFYAVKASHFYGNDEKIAGISLYNYQVTETCFQPFRAIDDDCDIYFMQVASSWGQLWTKTQWQKFREWLILHPQLATNYTVPHHLQKWGEHSWKKHFNHYLISSDTYFVFPRLSLSSCFDDRGTNSSGSNIFQVPIQISHQDYTFKTYGTACAIYDAWFEIKPYALNNITSQFRTFKYEVDLYGNKELNSEDDYVLTSKSGPSRLHSFSSDMFPLISNVILKVEGNQLGFYKKSDNVLKNRKLRISNHHSSSREQKEISILLPLPEFDLPQLQKTLNSIASQSYAFYELVFVVNSSICPLVEKMLLAYQFKAIVIPVTDLSLFDITTLKSLKKCTGEIISLLNQGSVLKEDVLSDINLVFNSFSSVNWVRGIDELFPDKDQYEKMNVFDYRIIRGNVHTQLATKSCDFSMEGHFFKRNCVQSIDENTFLISHGVLSLIEKFQLNVVVKCFVIKSNTTQPQPVDLKTLELISSRFGPETLRVKILSFLFKVFFSKTNSSNWIYTVSRNYPDVLRYDAAHKTFYFAKN